MLDDHKGWVNGVCWDPLNQFIATISSDRMLRVYNTKNYKNTCKTYKAQLPQAVLPSTNTEDAVLNDEMKNVRLFHDDTFQSFFRRMDMSPDGQLLVIPSGVLEIDGEATVKNCTYVFSRTDLSG